MTPDHIKDALFIATRADNTIDFTIFAKFIQFKTLDEVLSIARANTILSNDANELYHDLQAYDRFERGFNF